MNGKVCSEDVGAWWRGIGLCRGVGAGAGASASVSARGMGMGGV